MVGGGEEGGWVVNRGSYFIPKKIPTSEFTSLPKNIPTFVVYTCAPQNPCVFA